MKRTTLKKFTGGGGWETPTRTYSNNKIIDGIIKGHRFSTNSTGILEVWLLNAKEEKSFRKNIKKKKVKTQCSNGIFNYTVKPSGKDYNFVSDTSNGLQERWKSAINMGPIGICRNINMGYKFSSGKDNILRMTNNPYDMFGKLIKTNNITHKSPNKSPNKSHKSPKSPKSPNKSPNKSHKSPKSPNKSPSKSPNKSHKSPNKSHKSPNKSSKSPK